MGDDYAAQLKAEVGTWCIADEAERREKITRERIRHHKLVKDLLLDQLPTNLMDIFEVGGGPFPVSDLIPFRSRVVYDPCTIEYRKYFPCRDHFNQMIEEVASAACFSLGIATNSLDHVQSPEDAVARMDELLIPGGYLAIMCAENNALTNPHPCHEINLTAELIHRWLDEEYETVWELTYAKDGYRYGWVEFEEKRGQPAFALLLRKCSGY